MKNQIKRKSLFWPPVEQKHADVIELAIFFSIKLNRKAIWRPYEKKVD